MNSNDPQIVAALGPTNTGKTHRAVQRMLDHQTGMIGLPLRLLAREVYDRLTPSLGESQVALVTGEEKRIPSSPRYWICTVEAMPTQKAVDFVAVDEVQLAGHLQRGHVFTQRILHARGRQETWFMGAETIRPLMRELVPTARVQRFPRLSHLAAAGTYSIGSLPPRSAIVAFSAPRLYALAERLRARRGGAAVVLGSLSPRARNAQVAMYQAGEVDYLVATDAIGMGLNLDVERIAFSERRKFDGREVRWLELAELSQIAGRAGRHRTDGEFGTLAPEPRLPAEFERRIQTHQLTEQRTLVWRNHELCFDSVDTLIETLKQRPAPGPLRALARADDFQALTTLASREEIRQRAILPAQVQLLWDVCQIPDYRQLLMQHHENQIGELFCELNDRGSIGDAWLEPRVRRLERRDGGIETLMQRMAFIRTWTYVANHDRWLENPRFWRERTSTIEDALSDALHEALVARFIDTRRKSVHGRIARDAPPDPGHPFSALAALRADLSGEQPRSPDTTQFARELAEARHAAFAVSERGGVSFAGVDVGKFVRGRVLIEPEVSPLALDFAPGALGQVQRRLRAFAKDFARETLGNLADQHESASPALRGLLYQLRQGLGTLTRQPCSALLASLTDTDRRLLGELGICVGQRLVFASELLTHSCLSRRQVLVTAYYQNQAPALPRGSLAQPTAKGTPDVCYLALGFGVAGRFAIRADVLEGLLEGAREHYPVTARAIGRRCQVGSSEARQIARILQPGANRRRRSRTRPARVRPRRNSTIQRG